MSKSRFTKSEIKEFLLKYGSGFDEDEATEVASSAVKEGTPIIETMCFLMIVEDLLAPIHKTAWLTARARNTEWDFDGVIKRLLDSGASVKDLTFFARAMQKQFMSNLGCLLDGSGINCPSLPFTDFRILAVDDNGKPIALLEDLHEALSVQSYVAEMRQSRATAKLRKD
jgi:hypothetical protein